MRAQLALTGATIGLTVVRDPPRSYPFPMDRWTRSSSPRHSTGSSCRRPSPKCIGYSRLTGRLAVLWNRRNDYVSTGLSRCRRSSAGMTPDLETETRALMTFVPGLTNVSQPSYATRRHPHCGFVGGPGRHLQLRATEPRPRRNLASHPCARHRPIQTWPTRTSFELPTETVTYRAERVAAATSEFDG